MPPALQARSARVTPHAHYKTLPGPTYPAKGVLPRRAIAIGLLCLITLFAQEPSSSLRNTALAGRDALKKDKEPGPSEPKRLFRTLALQLFPGRGSGAAASDELGGSARFQNLAAILLGLIFVQWVALIVQAYYLYKVAAESRRASHLLRDNLKVNRQALEVSRQALILSQPPKLTIRSVEVRPRPYASGEPFNVFPPDTTIECRFLVRNAGGSRATVLYSAVTLFVIPHSEPLPMVSPLNGVTPNDPIIPNMQLKPGEFTFGIFVRRTNHEEEGSIKDLYVIGWLDYVDDIGNLKHTNFCRMYMRGRFVPVNDPDYEDE